MKRMKKILAVLLAAIMVMSLGISVLADDKEETTTTTTTYTENVTETSFTITVNGVASSSHTMKAYQIFSGTLAKQTTTVSDGTDITGTDDYILSDIGWGNGIDSSKIRANQTINDATYSSIYAALASISYTKTENVATATVYPFTSDKNEYSSGSDNLLSTAAAVADALDAYDNDSDVVNQFAKIITYYLSSTATANLESSGSSSPYTYSGTVDSAGYYLITDSINSDSTATDDAVSDYILRVTGDATATAKDTTVPTVRKVITSDNLIGDSSAAESSSNTAAYGGVVEYKISITLPKSISEYGTYSLTVNDTLASGLDLATDFTTNGVTVTVYNDEETGVGTVGSSGYSVYTESTGDYTLATGATFAVVFSDVKSLADSDGSSINVASGSKIVITYSATVDTDGTDVNTGTTANTNSVSVVYPNDVNSNGTGTTTPSLTYTYVTSLQVTKTDGEGNALSGAKFSLYMVYATNYTYSDNEGATNYISTDEVSYYIYNESTGEMTKVESSNVDTLAASSTTVYVQIGEETAASLDSDTSSYVASFAGLSAGSYMLIETTTPAGYNTADPVSFTVTASGNSTDGDGSSVKWESSNNKVSVLDGGILSTTIVNESGATLPVTGGIGTTIFYVVGAVLVVGAAVILITRRRMGNRA